MTCGNGVLLCAWLALIGTACATPSPSNVVTVAVLTSPNSLDPRVGSDETSQRVHQLIYDNLLALDNQLKVVGGLAADWEQVDPLTYVVRLRPGVKFHDGHELTSADVVFTFNSFIDPNFVSARKGAYRTLDRVEAVDPLTVRFTLKEPFGSFPIQLVMPVVPNGAGPELRDRPIGTGPYRFVSAAVDDRVELAAFAEYFRGRPANDGVVLKVVPDEIMRALELRKGTVDMVVNDLSPDVIHQLAEEKSVTIAESPGTDYAYIGINMRDAVLKDKRVRHALGYAINRQAIVDYLRRGLARPAIGILPPASWAFDEGVFQFTYHPDTARALLDEAGYPDPDGDGPAPRLRLSLKVSTNEFIRLQAAVIQQDLKAVGIDLDVRSYEFATLYTDVLKGNFQLFTLQWVGVSDPDMLRRVFHSKQMPPTGFNRGYYENPEVDRLIDAAMIAASDAERRRLYAEAQRLIAEDAPYISLWYKTNVAVSRTGIAGVRLSPSAEFTFLREVTKQSTAPGAP
ncbi:MAG TPA: ABC transporter substrate-binding protein [Vicinamibacterales bacterium]|nr:ABC transporter substrate-binding protein [Vicinamibacterales bacterium]